MIYDLSQPIFNKVPHWLKFRHTAMTIPHLTTIESANLERLRLMSHTGTHVDAPFHFFSGAEAIHALPLSHFRGQFLAFKLRHEETGTGLVAADFEPPWAPA